MQSFTRASSQVTFLILLLVLATALVPPVAAHAVIIPNKSVTGEEQEYTIAVVGEKDNPTVEVEVLIPRGFKIVKVFDVEGWDEHVKNSSNGSGIVIWKGKLELDETAKLRIRLRNPDEEGLYKFTVIQTYYDGEEAEWNFPGTWVRLERPSLQDLVFKNLVYLVIAVVALVVALAVWKKLVR